MQRTIRLQLNTTAQQVTILKDTLVGFTTAFNYVCNYGWQQKECNGISLHKATYYQLRANLPGLPSQLVCAARVKATEALKSVFTLVKKYPEKIKAWEKKRPTLFLRVKFTEVKSPGCRLALNPSFAPSAMICVAIG